MHAERRQVVLEALLVDPLAGSLPPHRELSEDLLLEVAHLMALQQLWQVLQLHLLLEVLPRRRISLQTGRTSRKTCLEVTALRQTRMKEDGTRTKFLPPGVVVVPGVEECVGVSFSLLLLL